MATETENRVTEMVRDLLPQFSIHYDERGVLEIKFGYELFWTRYTTHIGDLTETTLRDLVKYLIYETLRAFVQLMEKNETEWPVQQDVRRKQWDGTLSFVSRTRKESGT